MEVENSLNLSTREIPFDQFEACLLCKSVQLISLEGYEQNYLVKCLKCNFVFCKRMANMDELNTHYVRYPRANSISEITLKRYNELLNTFEQYRKTNNLLDVGCGDGFFLAEAKKRNWNVFGTEFTSEAIDVCQKKGIPMTVSPINPSHYQNQSFDVITSFEVIEHISTPHTELQSFQMLLRKGGVLYITTPNFNSLSRNILKSKWNVIEYPEHLSYYTVQTLSALCCQYHFKCISVATTGISINRLRAGVNPKNSNLPTVNTDEVMRQKSEEKTIFKILKWMINSMLNATRKGDAMKVLFQKL